MSITDYRPSGSTILLVGCLVAVFVLGRDCGVKSRDDEVQQLSKKLATTQETLEIKEGLFAAQTQEMEGIGNILLKNSHDIIELQLMLESTKQKLLTADQLVLKWKNAYEAAVKDATQTEEGGRKRVDFSQRFGLYNVSGNTLTDPPEAFLKLEQVDPLNLTVAVAKGKDGKWTSFVTSNDPNLDVKVALSAVDPNVSAPSWKQRIWADIGLGFLGDKGGQVGVSYRLDRMSLGAFCGAFGGGGSCGLTVGFRVFK